MQTNLCDNCSKPSTHKRGIIIEKDYCDVCVGLIDVYLKAVDDLHDRLAKEWTEELRKLRQTDMVLPDVR